MLFRKTLRFGQDSVCAIPPMPPLCTGRILAKLHAFPGILPARTVTALVSIPQGFWSCAISSPISIPQGLNMNSCAISSPISIPQGLNMNSRGCNPRTRTMPFCRPTRKGLNILWHNVFDPSRVVEGCRSIPRFRCAHLGLFILDASSVPAAGSSIKMHPFAQNAHVFP